jgi:23S rRNA (uracil1939-C5)-methyltransferase
MQPSDNLPSFELTLSSPAYGGDAIGRLPDGRAVFVPYGIPGEVVRIQLTEEKARFARGKIVEILTASSDRSVPRCRHFTRCGGCHYQHVAYERQLEMKSEILRDLLRRIGGLIDPPIAPVVPSLRQFNYRNHIQFHPLPTGELSFYRAHSKHLFPVQECHLPEAEINVVWPQIEIEKNSRLEKIGLRSGEDGDLLLIFEASGAGLPEFSVEGLAVSALYVLDGKAYVMAGSPYSSMEIQGKRLRVTGNAFFQVNSQVAAAMVGSVMGWVTARKPRNLLEVYAGVGLFSAFLAPLVDKLAAIEADPAACEDFSANLDEFDHIELYEGHAEEIVPLLEFRPDCVLVDPPRAGLGERLIQAILDFSPDSLIYISCDPATLARDARFLSRGSYRLAEVIPFDMFPQTYHIESASLWLRPP